MIKSFTAYTEEIDDVDVAIAGLMEQLQPDDKLLKNSVGLLSCTPDYIESGVLEALTEALPFEVLGQTTIAAAANNSLELGILGLMVLTSDDVEFVTAHTDPITPDSQELIKESYLAATAGRDQQPSLIVAYVPLLTEIGGDFFLDAIDKYSGGVPTFGSLAVDGNIDYRDTQVIFDGQGSKDQMAYLLFYGEVQPKFYLATISHEKIFEERGVVTASVGNLLQSVNDQSALEFLKLQGLVPGPDGTIEAVNSFPYIVDLDDDSEPYIRVMFATTPEGYAVCGGNIPVGATLSVGYFNETEILKTTEEKLAQLDLANWRPDGLLIFSCVGRYFSLGYDVDGEILKVRSALENTQIPYLMTYSGGEICPTYSKVESTSTTNRFHNSTFVVCAF